MQILKIRAFLRDNFILIFMAVIISFFIVEKEQEEKYNLKIAKTKYSNSIVEVDRDPSNEKLFMQIGFNNDEKDLPKELRYVTIDQFALKKVLKSRNSILIDEPYFSTIISVAENLDIHPLLMFAVLGQEQGFVPRNNIYALDIANNPFNVFGSWQKYNTNIKDSSEIAARTLINLSTGRPDGEDPIKWINLRNGEGGYAEDENWWIGVKSIFEKLKNETQ